MSTVLSALRAVLSYVLGGCVLVLAWIYASDQIVALLDFNLVAIKWIVAQIPSQYSSQVEAALRLALHADKALLFAEAGWAVSGAMRFVGYLLGRKSDS